MRLFRFLEKFFESQKKSVSAENLKIREIGDFRTRLFVFKATVEKFTAHACLKVF